MLIISAVVLITVFAASLLAVVVLIENAPLLEELDESPRGTSAIEAASIRGKSMVSGPRSRATTEPGGICIPHLRELDRTHRVIPRGRKSI